MNIKELKEMIKDVPDDVLVTIGTINERDGIYSSVKHAVNGQTSKINLGTHWQPVFILS